MRGMFLNLMVGDTPHIQIVHCAGNLEVRGWTREQTVIESPDSHGDVQQAEGGLVVSTNSHCSVRLPEGGRLTILKCDGNLRIKDVLGDIVMEHVGGTSALRRIGSLNGQAIGGHLNLREINGALTFEKVGGNLTVRDAKGPIKGEKVGGHFSGRNIPKGAHIDLIGGNLALRTDLDAETSYNFDVAGSADISVPESVNARFIIEATGSIKADPNLQMSLEGRQRIFVAGNGAAMMRISAAGSVRLKQRSYYSDDEELPVGIEDFSEQLDDTFVHLDAQFENIEAQLEAIPQHIRSKVSRKLDSARRRMMDAHRRVSQTIASASRDVDVPGWGDVDLGGGAGEPVSEKERLMILEMLEQGKISVADAQKLLEALEGRAV